MKNHLVSILMCLLSSGSWAQNITIKGRIIEKLEGQVTAVAFANISLLKDDSTFVIGTTSGSKGVFTISNIKPGSYLLSSSFVGYIPVEVELRNLVKSIDLGSIVMSESSIALKEVTVSASNITQKIDRMIIQPTASMLKSAYSSYDLLNNMMIPRLLVNSMAKTIEVNGGGEVQMRINGIKASETEVAALRAQDIVRVEFIENPGQRYGSSSLGAVVDIIVCKRDAGGLVNIQATDSPHMLFGENNLSVKFNHGKSEWGLNYGLTDKEFKKIKRDLNETYYLGDKTIERIQKGINDKMKFFKHAINLSYNLSDPNRYTFNVVFRNNINNTPYDNKTNSIYEQGGSDSILSKTRNSFSSYSPSLDVYFQRILPNNQKVEFNLIGTLINTDLERNYGEFTPETELTSIQTIVNGNKRSIIGEGIYDKEFKDIKISAGIRHYQMYAENKYTGTSSMISDMNQSKTSAFCELQGKIKTFNYAVGAGISHSYFKEGDESNTYFLFTPTIRLSIAPHKNGNLSYRFNIDPSIPSLSSLTNVEQALDTIQIVRGNPKLKTFKIFSNQLNYSCFINKFIISFNMDHQFQKNPIMESIFIENNKLIIMDENQHSFQRLNTNLTFGIRSLSIGTLKDFLSLSVAVGYTKYWSKGILYSHAYDDFYYNTMGMLSYKSVSLLAQYSRNPYSLFGETIQKSENKTAFMVMYNNKKFQVGAGILFPFTNNYRTGSERKSRIAPLTSWTYAKEAGKMITLTVAYNFEFGKKYKSGKKNLNNSDSDSGILNTNR
ncbi:MAG: TonB-dependent receptor [Bacteroidetes bacterium]|nr:TonB-dependent receptor [Bacteroidota bacterium]